MGVVGAWDGVQPTSVLPLRDWCHEFLARQQRLPTIAVDISNHIYQVSTEKKSRDEGIEHTQLARRLLAFLALGCTIVCVFDGPMTVEKRRHAKAGRALFLRQASPMVTYAKRLARALQIAVVEAKAEAEAQCAALQRKGQVDVVFTSDADVLANGATRILRYGPLSANTGQTAASRVVKYYELDAHDAPVFAMEAMLLGNDWADGVKGIGRTIAKGISQRRTGFATWLARISVDSNADEIAEWREALLSELRTNKHKWLAQRCNSSLPPNFPDMKVLNMLLRPSVHETVSTCAPQLASTRDKPCMQLVATLESLEKLWFQQSPNFGGNGQKTASAKSLSADAEFVASAKQLASFQTAAAPVVVASLLVRDAPELRAFTFKRVENSRTVEVVKCPVWNVTHGSTMAPTFLAGARVPGYLIDGKINVQFAQKPAPVAIRQNSTLDGFLRLGTHTRDAEAPGAARAQSSPAAPMGPSAHKPSVATRHSAGVPVSVAVPAIHNRGRRPLESLDPAETNKAAPGLAAAKAPMFRMKMPSTVRRSRSKLLSDTTDTRVEHYFRPAPTRPLLARQHEPPKTPLPAAAGAQTTREDAEQRQDEQTRVVDLTQDTPLADESSSEYEPGDSDTDPDTDPDAEDVDETPSDDDTLCVELTHRWVTTT